VSAFRDLRQRRARQCAAARKSWRVQSLENLASGIDADISRNVELYDLVAACRRQQHGDA